MLRQPFFHFFKNLSFLFPVSYFEFFFFSSSSKYTYVPLKEILYFLQAYVQDGDDHVFVTWLRNTPKKRGNCGERIWGKPFWHCIYPLLWYHLRDLLSEKYMNASTHEKTIDKIHEKLGSIIFIFRFRIETGHLLLPFNYNLQTYKYEIIVTSPFFLGLILIYFFTDSLGFKRNTTMILSSTS